jgi:hypothetical protein
MPTQPARLLSVAFGESGFPVDEAVSIAVDVFLAHPRADQDETLTALADRGLAPREAWRLYQFVPIAFCHVVLRGSGVGFEPAYLSVHPDTGVRERRLLSDEPIYTAAVRLAEERVAAGAAELLPVLGRSAEYAVINHLLHQGSQLRHIRLVEPALFEFAE